MPIPTWNVGQVLSPADVNSWFVPLAAYKPSLTARTSTTAVTNDPDLALTVAASAVYSVEGLLFYQGGTTGSSDFKFGWNAPSGALFYWGAVYLGGGSLAVTVSAQQAVGDTLIANTNTTSSQYHLQLSGTLITSASGGTFALAWAQGTSSGTSTTLLARSRLVLQEIS